MFLIIAAVAGFFSLSFPRNLYLMNFYCQNMGTDLYSYIPYCDRVVFNTDEVKGPFNSLRCDCGQKYQGVWEVLWSREFLRQRQFWCAQELGGFPSMPRAEPEQGG